MSLEIFGPYAGGCILLLICATRFTLDEKPRGWLDRLPMLAGPCFAIPIAVFGMQHLVSARSIMPIVPVWMPARLFWTYLVGVALVSAAFSIALRIRTRLSAPLLALMLFLFVVLIHVPGVYAKPHDRFFWALACRDLSFACGAFALRYGWPLTLPGPLARRLSMLVGLIAVFYGVEQLLHPQNLPAVPLSGVTPDWAPARNLWGFVTGLALTVGGAAMCWTRTARLASLLIGLVVLVDVSTLYLAFVIADRNIVSIDYLTDTMMFAGVFLALGNTAAAPVTDRSPGSTGRERIVAPAMQS